MKFLICFLAVLSILNITSSFDLNEYEKLINSIKLILEIEQDFQNNIKDILEIEPNYFDFYPKNFSFSCKTSFVSKERPTSVHRLRPGDINVVAALGDSITAAVGNNAKTIAGLLVEYRGRSWSIGGNERLEKLITLPNILKKFNPKLKGYSVGPTIVSLSNAGHRGLNVAISGQKANHMPDQARTLVQRLREDKNIDFKNDWKLITLFIGGNDACAYCKDKAFHSPQAYIDYIQEALDIFYNEVPNAFVNLVTVLKVYDVRQLNKGLVCNVLHRFMCSCGAFPKSDADEKELVDVVKQYQNYTEYLVKSGRYDGREDFAVVNQPLFLDYDLPRASDGKPDYSFFAPDCFHFSTKGHTAGTLGLWNNMLQPVGKKSTTTSPDATLLCPTEQSPYLFTNKNSYTNN